MWYQHQERPEVWKWEGGQGGPGEFQLSSVDGERLWVSLSKEETGSDFPV